MNRAPEPTSKELKVWARLASLATACADQVGLATGDLAAAALQARKSVVPGLLSRDNSFVRLQRFAERFVAATTAQRRDMAAELKSLADDCGRLLAVAAPEPSTPQPRLRADIDG